MIKLLLALAILAPLSYGAMWLADHPGTLAFDWLGWRVEMALSLFAALLLGLIILTTLTLMLWFGIASWPARMKQRRFQKNHTQGLTAITQTLVALSAADYKNAQRHLQHSMAHLPDHPALTGLLDAQLARAQGQTGRLPRIYALLKENADTRPLALRGLIEQNMAAQQSEIALTHIQEVLAEFPKDAWANRAAIDLMIAQNKLGDAEKQIKKSSDLSVLNRQQTHHLEALIATIRGEHHLRDNRLDDARASLKIALKRETDFLPARLIMADVLNQIGDRSALLKHAQRSWKHQPHPHVVALILNTFSHESPATLERRVEQLIAAHPDHVESLMAKAQLYLRLAQWEKAREILRKAKDIRHSPRVFEALAQLEKSQHKDEMKANEWLKFALDAPRDESWICSSCGYECTAWHAHCPNCAAMDSLTWRLPNAPIVSLPN